MGWRRRFFALPVVLGATLACSAPERGKDPRAGIAVPYIPHAESSGWGVVAFLVQSDRHGANHVTGHFEHRRPSVIDLNVSAVDCRTRLGAPGAPGRSPADLGSLVDVLVHRGTALPGRRRGLQRRGPSVMQLYSPHLPDPRPGRPPGPPPPGRAERPGTGTGRWPAAMPTSRQVQCRAEWPTPTPPPTPAAEALPLALVGGPVAQQSGSATARRAGACYAGTPGLRPAPCPSCARPGRRCGARDGSRRNTGGRGGGGRCRC